MRYSGSRRLPVRRMALHMLLAVAFGLPPGAAQEPETISRTLAPVPERGDVNYGLWLEFRKPGSG